MQTSLRKKVEENIYLLGYGNKLKFWLILGSMILASCGEAIGLGIVVPFVAILIKPQFLHDNYILKHIYDFFGIHNYNVFVAVMALGLVVFFIAKNSAIFFSQLLQIKFVFNKYKKFSETLFRYYLYLPYSIRLKSDTPTLLRNAVSLPVDLINGYMLPMFILITETVMLCSIMAFLLWFDFAATVFIGIVLGLSVFIFNSFVKDRLYKNGEMLQNHRAQMNKQVIQSLGSVKETKILQKEHYFYNEYKKYLHKTSVCSAFTTLISQTPRPFIETISVALVLGTMMFLLFTGNSSGSIVIKMSVFGMAAIRLLPGLTRLVSSTALVRSNYAVVNLIVKDLKEATELNSYVSNVDITQADVMPFEYCVNLKNINFRYENKTEDVLKSINMKILNGQTVGLVGRSGAGKTTLVDLLLGILKPTSGEILVDDKNIESNLIGWRKQVGYVPQKVYILNDNIKRNVAFGVREEDVDESKVWQALQLAQLKSFVEVLPNKLNEAVGEEGARLSGGQCQRIGIARALYHNPSLLVLDEATAALDSITENEIINAIYNIGKEKTIIMIAHRLSTVKNCDVLFFLENGHVIDQGTYQELCEYNAKFKILASV